MCVASHGHRCAEAYNPRRGDARLPIMLIAQCQRWLLAAAALYLALMPTNAATFGRSVLFGVSSLLAVILIAAAWTGRGERISSPGYAILTALLIWCGWDFA